MKGIPIFSLPLKKAPMGWPESFYIYNFSSVRTCSLFLKLDLNEVCDIISTILAEFEVSLITFT